MISNFIRKPGRCQRSSTIVYHANGDDTKTDDSAKTDDNNIETECFAVSV